MSVNRAEAFTFSFPAVDPTNRPARVSGITFAAGDAKISKDGGAAASTTNTPAAMTTGPGRYTLALTATEMDAAWVHVFIENASMDPWDQGFGTDGFPSGTVLTDAGNTASTFKTDLASTITDHWKYPLIRFTTGTRAGEVQKISGYDGTTKFISLASALTGTPSNGDRFVLVNK